MKILTAIIVFVAAALALAGGYVFARMHRFEISHGGSDRYYVVVRLDRWTGEAWKLESHQTWVPIQKR